MVDRARLLERLMVTFLDELDEHVQTLSDGVLALEKGLAEDGRGEKLSALFRAAHSLKGASRAVDQAAIEQVCHVLEDVLGGIRDGRLEPGSALCTLLLKTADAIGAAGQCLRAKEPVDENQLEELRAAVKTAATGESVEVPDSAKARPVKTPAAAASEGQAAASEGQATNDARLTGVTRGDSGSDSVRVSAAVPVQAAAAVSASVETAPATVAAAAQIATPTERHETAQPETEVKTAARSSAASKSHGALTVRVSQEKLDALLAQTGELLVVRQRVESHPVELEALAETVAEWKREWQGAQRSLVRLVENGGADPLLARSGQHSTRLLEAIESNGERLRELERLVEHSRRQTLGDARQLNLVGGALQDEVHRIRMVPFAEACAGLERAVRDIALVTGKDVELELQGGEIEVDRSVITGLTDPLLHLVRNAVDHGLEAPEERDSLGKPTCARVTVSASLRGAQVQVVVADDGRGLNLQKIRDRLRRRGLPEPSSERDLMNSIFLPGFSTAEVITDVSGRGVGMDVVKSQVEGLHGTIEIATQPGLGSRFTMLVPLTLTTINAVFVEISGQPFLLPSSNVRKLVRFLPSEMHRVQGQEMLSLGGAPLPVVSLDELLGRTGKVSVVDAGRLTGVVAQAGGREAVLIVDRVVSEREIVVKNLGPRIQRVPHVSGATLLKSGEIALLLNVPVLLRAIALGRRGLSVSLVEDASPAAAVAKRVLVVDDSVTTRTLIRSILEAAGYDVEAAVDGQDALDRLHAATEDFALVVSDVDMPRVDGFELTRSIRAEDRHQNLPVVLVTSRGSEQDKAQGVRAGANAYLIKSQFDQSNILETIEQLI